MDNPRTLIIGGGIGGLAFAGARARRGVDVRVVEIQPEWRITPSGITLQPPAIRALDRLGLLDELTRRGATHTETHHCDPKGHLISTTYPDALAGPGKPRSAGILRTELHTMLLDRALAEGAQVDLGLTASDIRRDGDEVQVTFTDGSSDWYGLVVGADGLRTKTRKWVADVATDEPNYVGASIWRAVVPRHPDISTVSVFYGRRVAGVNPVSPDQMYVFAISPSPEPARIEDSDLVSGMRELLDGFEGVLADVREQITEPAQIVARPIWSYLMEPPWHKDRVVLMGDAVHAAPPTMAFGGAMALEDAIVLDEVLSDTSNVDDALQRFVERRWPRSRDTVERTVDFIKAVLVGVTGPEAAKLEARAFEALAPPL